MATIDKEKSITTRDSSQWKDQPLVGFNKFAKQEVFNSFNESKELEDLYQVFGKSDDRSYHNFLIGFLDNVNVVVTETRGNLNLRFSLNRKNYFTHISNTCSQNFKIFARRKNDCLWLSDLISPEGGTEVVDLLLNPQTFTVVIRKLVNASRRKRGDLFQRMVEASETAILDELRKRLNQ